MSVILIRREALTDISASGAPKQLGLDDTHFVNHIHARYAVPRLVSQHNIVIQYIQASSTNARQAERTRTTPLPADTGSAPRRPVSIAAAEKALSILDNLR